MPTLQAELLVIGGGATGAGVAWDAALRGFDVVLVDRADLAEGTSGRFHGLLHSGGRYVVKDPVAAEECVAENAILRRVIPDCIEDTGGLFVTTPDDDPAYGDRVSRRLSRLRPSRRGDRRRGGAAARAAPEPRHPARVRRARRVDRRMEDRLVVRARRIGARGADPAVSPRDRPAPGGRCGHGRARAQRAHGRGARHRGGLHDQRRAARGPRRSPTWRGSRASGSCPARGS